MIGEQKRQTDASEIGVIVFGSDQGLVGQFNEVVTDYAIKTLTTLPGKPDLGRRGTRSCAPGGHGAVDEGTFPRAEFRQSHHPARRADSNRKRSASGQRRVFAAMRFHNRPQSGALYEPVSQRLLPLDAQWQQELAESVGRPGACPR